MHLKRTTLLGTTVLAGVLAMTSAPAFAQTTSSQDEDATQVEEIVVTGSRIRRDPTNAPTPLIQVQRQQLLETGLPTVIDYLATIPALSNSLVPSDTTGNNLNDGGLEFANLRSLGSGRTLTLVDGRRHVGSAAGSLAVDVSTIPRLLLESVEIITGGASSVYGADAVSGVVNYVLRKDFEGLEVNANYGQLVGNSDRVTRRVSALAGINLFDDRLNLYAHAEYEKADEVLRQDLEWLGNGSVILGVDADPSSSAIGPAADGTYDTALFFNARRLDRPLWGSTTLANMQRPSALNNPHVPLASCTSFSTASACFNVDPAYTYWYDGTVGRLANFGQRIGNTGANRPWNIGGDGEDANNTTFDYKTVFPEQEAQRYQAGLNFRLTDNIKASLEAKFTTEDAYDRGQHSFFDILIVDASLGGLNTGLTPGSIGGTGNFTTRTDNAFLPANVAAAIRANTFTSYNAPTADAPGTVRGTVAAPIANHRGFDVLRDQLNNREIERYVAAIEGSADRFLFIDSVNWGLSYVRGEMNNVNREAGHDVIRFQHAMDAVVDTAGVVNGRPGEIVCRVKLLAAQGRPIANQNPNSPDAFYPNPMTDPEVGGCVPLNVFGMGNQSAEALEYVSANIRVYEKNEQEQAVAYFAGNLWDFWGAGAIGVSLGAEWRREYTEGIGRSFETAGRYLQANTGADFIGAGYETNEYFAELSIPLLRDSWLGEYAEISGSYREFDYTTAGKGDVYGVNLIYRPIRDITFKTSFNTSFRAPNLTENFRPYSQTFANGFVDPCDARVIANFAGEDAATVRANRIANCSALAAAKGVNYNFSDQFAANAYLPTYSSGIAGVTGGNPFLLPETSESFTFSTVFQPRFVPDLTIILDYYEIRIDDVINSVSAQVASNRCVSGPGLDAAACAVIFRNNPNQSADPYNDFKVGAPSGDPIGGFITGSFNYAALETRGLDFSVRYRWNDLTLFGMELGSLSYALQGLWLIDQKNFSDISNPNFFTDSTTGVYFPRLEGTSTFNWVPNETFSFSWTLDWMASQDLRKYRDVVATGNLDVDPVEWWTTGNWYRNDFSMRYNVNDNVRVNVGVTNAFDATPQNYLGFASTFDPYGRRFNIGLNYRY